MTGREGGSIRTAARVLRPAALDTAAPLDVALVAVVAALLAGTFASVVVPGVHVQIFAPALDLVLDTITSVVTLGVAVLGWVRFRQRGEAAALFQAAAFLVLAVANTLTLTLMATGLDAQAGLTLADPGQAPLYVLTVARLFAAALLVVGGFGSLRARRADHPVAVVLGATATMLLLAALIYAGAARLAPLGSAAGPAAPDGPPGLPMPTPLGAAAQVLTAGSFLLAAGLSRRLYRRDGSVADAYLAVGLVFAAFAAAQTAIYPGVYTGVVTSGALLRLAFEVLLLLGIQAEAGATLARLRRANEELARLGAVEAEHAALAERARLSRELHDGLAQELWLAKLKSGRLAALPDLAPAATALVAELGTAIDAGLADAQQAVAALRDSSETTGTLREVMSRSVDEFADRCGMRVEFECPSRLPSLPTRAQAEALRIVQEALNNVRRHADATVVRLRAGVEDGRLIVTVGDNGRGFDPDAVGRGAYGLTSMRERAGLIGAELRIESRPSDGTRVSLLVPLALSTAPVEARTR